jgi:hypothetical protein
MNKIRSTFHSVGYFSVGILQLTEAAMDPPKCSLKGCCMALQECSLCAYAETCSIAPIPCCTFGDVQAFQF